MRSHRNCALVPHWAATRPRPRCSRAPVSWSDWPKPRHAMPSGCWLTPSGRCAWPRRRLPRCAPAANMTRRRGGGVAGWCARSTTFPSWWPRPARSPRRPANGCPDRSPTAPLGGSACMMAMPARSPRAAWASRSSSATKLRSPTTRTASSSITPSRWATRPTRRNWRRRSGGSPSEPGARQAPSPPTAATARNASRTPCMTLACARS